MILYPGLLSAYRRLYFADSFPRCWRHLYWAAAEHATTVQFYFNEIKHHDLYRYVFNMFISWIYVELKNIFKKI